MNIVWINFEIRFLELETSQMKPKYNKYKHF